MDTMILWYYGVCEVGSIPKLRLPMSVLYTMVPGFVSIGIKKKDKEEKEEEENIH